MADSILIDGDDVEFAKIFGVAQITVTKPGKLEGSGPATIDGKNICVDGDESNVEAECTYMTPVYSTPGQGKLKIQKLAGNQKAKKTQSGGKPVLLKGFMFQATMEVSTKAQLQTPSGPQQDAMPQYMGIGMFKTQNKNIKGT